MKRLLGTVGLFICVLALTATPLAALTPTYTVTGAYKSSQYHKNLTTVTKTGDKALDTVAAALSQLGYNEGNSTAQLGGTNKTGNKNFTEYNRFIGTIGGSYSYAWCAAFVSWCLDVAEAGSAAGGRFTSCTLWVEKLQKLGLYSTRASGYVPKTGDLVFFRSAGTARASDHVGLVRFVQDGRVFTVEGNASNKVGLHDYALKDTYIVGYGRPQYETLPLAGSPVAWEDTAGGLYVISYDFVNVREKAAATGTKLGTLAHGTLVEVKKAENGWGEITYKDKQAYISLDYADFITPVFYRVNYLANGGENTPPTTSYLSVTAATVTPLVPTLAGHVFSHWQDETGKAFLPGDTLPQKSLTLTAVFTPAPEPPQEDGGAADTPAEDEGAPPPLPDTAPPDAAPLPDTEGTTDTARAAAEAGTISGVLAAAAGLWWAMRKFHLI
ncbi:MAG: CHAP domain-containing protein [Ruminococcaceae bacterium]|nr:CHAP domain-containing protein [Oscillospiraceae bacterium]